MMSSILLTHAFVTIALVGLIWTVQIVHYPLFARVGVDAFPAYEAEHGRRMTVLVAPFMLAEAALAVAIFVQPVAAAPRWLAWAGLAMIVVVWMVTFLVSVPCHQRLARGFDAATHRRLVRTNWLRTAAWTIRGGIAMAMVA